MLNGLAPIMLFQFFKAVPDPNASNIPVATDIPKLPLPFIPLYLDEKLTGIYIQNETKQIDIETKIDTKADGSAPNVNQKGLGETVTIQFVADQGSIGIQLLAAMSSLILDKVTSREYSVTYLHRSMVLFNGLLHSVTLNPRENTTLFDVTVVLSRGKGTGTEEPTAATPQVQRDPGALPLSAPGPATSVVPPAPLPAPPPPAFNLGVQG